jgi:hypothetical protein
MIFLKRQRAMVLLVTAFVTLTLAGRFAETVSSAVTAESTTLDNNLHLPMAFNRHDSTLGIPIFGIQTYGASYKEQITNSGARWLRAHVGWRQIEPNDVTPRLYQWQSADNAIRPLLEIAGVNLIVTIDDTPDWASLYGGAGRKGPIRTDKLPEFAAFIQALVERYDGDGYMDAPGSPVVRHWEFYNEPDSSSTPGDIRWGNYAAAYAQMLAVAYPAAKAANSQTQVVFGGIAYDWFQPDGPFVREFLDDVLQAGGGQHFDVMNYHAYPAFASSWTTLGPGLLEKSTHIRGKLAAHGLQKPLIITEAGWHSNSTSQFPWTNTEVQARYIVQLFVQSMAANLQMMIWWTLSDPGGFYPYENGLLTYEGVRKPAFYAYQTMVAQLSTSRFVRRYTPADTGVPDLEVYQFDDRGFARTIYVAWLNPVYTTSVYTWRLPVAQVTVRNIYGSATVVNAGPDGFVSINVGAQPVYIEVK